MGEGGGDDVEGVEGGGGGGWGRCGGGRVRSEVLILCFAFLIAS